MAACYGLDGPGIKPWWWWDFLQLSRLAPGPSQPPVRWVLGLFPGCKVARAWCWPPTPIKHWGWRKSRPVALLPLCTFMACTRINSTFYCDCPWLFWRAAVNSFCCIQHTLVTPYKEVYKDMQEKVKQLKIVSLLVFSLSLHHAFCHAVNLTTFSMEHHHSSKDQHSCLCV